MNDEKSLISTDSYQFGRVNKNKNEISKETVEKIRFINERKISLCHDFPLQSNLVSVQKSRRYK